MSELCFCIIIAKNISNKDYISIASSLSLEEHEGEYHHVHLRDKVIILEKLRPGLTFTEACLATKRWEVIQAVENV
jgi:hypothetical protein